MLAFDRAVLKRDSIEVGLAFDRTSARSFDVDGRLHVKSCRISKANVCPYYGREIPDYKALGLAADQVYMLYRDPVELEKGAASFRNAQLLMLHAVVNARDPKKHVTVGTVGSGIVFDGTYLVADQLTVWASDGIKLIESEEAAELSCSYRYRADMTPGVAPDGVAYDGVMRDIKGNHVALVREGRAGSDVVVSDSLPLELHTMKRPHLMAYLAALGLLAESTDEAGKLALDEKLCGVTAKDADPSVMEDMEDDPENPGKKRKKLNPGLGRPTAPGGALASDEAINAAVDAKIKAGGYVTKAEAETLANDAAAKARSDINELHIARDAVKPLVGVVAMDSAEAVYKFALEKEGVALDGVPSAAFAALVRERVAAKGAAPVKTTVQLAADGASAAAKAIPGLGRFQVGG